MRTAKQLPLLAFICLLTTAGPSSASLVWGWSFGGTETGTFTTSGTIYTAGSYTITGFEVTSSIQPAGIGTDWDVAFLGATGFIWDGTDFTQFWRFGGTATNGANIFHDTEDLRYSFYAEPGLQLGRLTDVDAIDEPFYVPFTDLSGGPQAVSAPAPLVLLTLGTGVFAFLRRRKFSSSSIKR